MDGDVPGKRPSYLRILRNRSFGSLWLGQVVSLSGDAIFDVALLWLVLLETGSYALVGVTQAAILIPAVLAAPVAGVYADRVNRRNLMIVSNVVEAGITGTIALLYLTGRLSFPLLILLVLLLFTTAQFFRAAIGAIVPRIVGREDLGAANSLFTLTTSANQLASYAIGGVIVTAFGAAVPITYDGLTFLIAAALFTLIARPYGRPRADGPPGEPAAPGRSFGSDFREGLRYVRGSRLLRQLILFGFAINFFGASAVALIAPYSKDWIHGDGTTYGFALAFFSLGSIVGAAVVGKVNFRAYVGKLLFAGVAAAGVLIALTGVVTTTLLAFPLFFLIGAALVIVNLPIQVLVQTKVPGELLGRAVTVLGSLLAAAQPAAAILAGGLAQATSIGAVFVGSGTATALVTLALYRPFAELRQSRY